MTPVGAYLKKLLYQYDCLVVAELGAFLTHYLPASFNESTEQYLPPRKRLAFNEVLRLDDGILINYIMLHDACTREEALRYISAFVTDLKQQIRTTGSFVLDGIGMLTQNEEGRLQFDPELRHNFFAEGYGFQPIPAVLCAPVDETAAEEAEPLLAEVVRPQSAVGRVLPLPVSSPAWRWVAAALLVGSLGTLSYFSVVEAGQPLQSSLNPVSLLRFPIFWSDPVATPPVAVARPVVEVSAPPAAAPGAVVVTPAPKPAPVSEPVHREAPVSAPVVAVVPAAKRPVVATRKEPVARYAYVVVAGSFARSRNAHRLQRRLRKAGFADAFVMAPKTRQELFRVAAFGTNQRAEADSAVSHVSVLTGERAGLMRTHL